MNPAGAEAGICCNAADALALCVARSSVALVYLPCRITLSLSFMRKDFYYLHQCGVYKLVEI